VSGLDLSGFFDAAVRGTEDLDLATLLASFGVMLTLRPKAHEEDVGGKPISKKEPPLLERGYLGVRVRKVGGDVRIRVVESGSPAQEAGLSAGDVIVACEGLRITGAKFLKTIQTYPPGTELDLVGFRRDELMRFKVTLGEPPRTHAFLTIDPEATETACARRAAWLGV
jgi:predicted metalloprotease with PDZ domain